MLQIDPSTGTATKFAQLSNLPGIGFANKYVCGEIDTNGNYYIHREANGGNIFKLNIDDIINYGLDGSSIPITTINLSSTLQIFDLAFNVNNGLLYSVGVGSGKLVSINPTTGNVTTIGSANVNPHQFGGLISAAGSIYGIENNNGGLYKFNLTTGNADYYAYVPPSSYNDAAHDITRELDLLDVGIKKTIIFSNSDEVEYKIKVYNNFAYFASDLKVEDIVPSNIPVSQMMWKLDSIGTGSTATGSSSSQQTMGIWN